MKNAMKKLMSLVLVAVLLVSAVPFQADAATNDVHNLTLQDGNATLANIQVVEGQYVPTLPTPEPVAGKKFAGWVYGNTLLTSSTVWSWGDGTAYAKWTQGVALTPHYGEGVAYANLPSVVYVYEGELIGNALPTPTRDGYTFKGWTYGNTQLTPATTWSFGANGGTIYAQWEQNAIQPPVTEPPVTEPPVTEPPVTEPPVTEPPVTEPTKYKVTFTDNMNAVLYAFEVEAGKYLSADQVNMVAADAAKSGYTLKWVSGDQAYYTSALTTVAINGTTTFRANYTANNLKDNGAVDEEWMKDIYLYIYTNNDIISPAKRVLLNNYTIVNDHKLSKAEILSVVDDYYKATNSNNGIIWKGAYQETNNITALDFVAGKDDTNNGNAYIDNLDIERSSNNVIIKVRVTGVTTATSTATADSSNPKTGDEIYMAVTVLGLSAASLAAVAYVYSKKRLAK